MSIPWFPVFATWKIQDMLSMKLNESCLENKKVCCEDKATHLSLRHIMHYPWRGLLQWNCPGVFVEHWLPKLILFCLLFLLQSVVEFRAVSQHKARHRNNPWIYCLVAWKAVRGGSLLWSHILKCYRLLQYIICFDSRNSNSFNWEIRFGKKKTGKKKREREYYWYGFVV